MKSVPFCTLLEWIITYIPWRFPSSLLHEIWVDLIVCRRGFSMLCNMRSKLIPTHHIYIHMSIEIFYLLICFSTPNEGELSNSFIMNQLVRQNILKKLTEISGKRMFLTLFWTWKSIPVATSGLSPIDSE